MIDRQRGALLGLAVGDALGAPVEGALPGTFSTISGYRGSDRLGPGEWTDDTSMALALADSMASVGWDPADQVCRYLAWCQQGEYSVNGTCFSIGMTTAGALVRFNRTRDARTSGDPSEHASSNGSIMRLAPVPIHYANLFPNHYERPTMNFRSVRLALLTLVFCLPAAVGAEIRFKHHFGDRSLSGSAWGQTALADLDEDGDLDFITGQSGGDIIWYEYHAADRWTRHLLGRDSPSEVGGAVLDVNRDGRPDFVTGGAWYENPGDPGEKSFKRHVFDAGLTKVHDVRIADLDGDTIPDVVTMSDRNDVRWYKIAADPAAAWKTTTIGPPVHSGICTGDIDSDGDTDVIRSNVWFENLQLGQKWVPHRMTEPWGASAIPWQDNATQTRTGDLNGDGRLDVVIADGENRNARIGWLEAPSDPKKGRWITHLLPKTDTASRGAYHCLHVGDFNGDGRPDVFSAEMEAFCGDRPPRWFVWENDGKGNFCEHVVLDANLGAHEAVCGDVDADGDLDVCSKLWRPIESNANGGRNHFDFLENLAK